jgi:hypothetical protein
MLQSRSPWLLLGLAVCWPASGLVAAEPAVVRSAASGLWSAPGTWEGAKLPVAGVNTQ